MTGHRRGSTSKRLGLLLLAVVLPPAVTLIWLGAQLLGQDREVLEQRELERRTAVGRATALAMRQTLVETERLFDGGPVPDGIARFEISAGGVTVFPATRALWTPTPRRLPSAGDGPFVDAARLEYQADVAAAMNIYEKLANAPGSALRAGALRRMARLHWRSQRWDDALATYRAMERLRDVSDQGMPADLIARRKAIDVLADAGRSDAVTSEATRLQQDLLDSVWSLDRDSWDLVVHDIEKWLDTKVTLPTDRVGFTLTAEALWQQFRGDAIHASGSPYHLIDVDGRSVTLLTRQMGGTGTIVLAVSSSMLQTWSRNAVDGGVAGNATVALLAASGKVVAGTPPLPGVPVIRVNGSDVGLPWTLALHSDAWSKAGEQFAYRQRLLSIGLAAILLLLAGGSYFLWRVVQRELAVGRLQTDFVAAVSHEFRTPLASLRHATELLEEDDEMPVERRRSFYELYRRNTERLHQLVESLLDFARMEAGRKVYVPQPIDPAALATQVVAEFSRQSGVDGGRIALEISAHGLQIHGDRDALTNALWNLLDNAVKYSPAGGPIRVSVNLHWDGVAIAVEDNGLGISSHEVGAIFQRFVRGRQAVELGIKGTGLGLAMVAHIVNAHGGDIEVVSKPGEGSTFLLTLPASSVAPDGAPHYEPV